MDSRLAIDSAVLLLYFVLIISIGLYMGRKEETLKDFALGGRRIPWWAVLASLVAAETSAGTFFGTPGEGFSHRDYTYLQLAFGTIIGRVLVSYIFIKPYYDYKVFSIYEYLTARFGVASKNAASAVFMITRLLASGARLYVAAIALALAYEMISGTRPNQTQTLWIYLGATIAIVILTAIYTTFGGIKAVIWTDLIQASIMIGSALIALALLYFAIPGGWHEIVQRHGAFQVSDLITTGLDPAKHGWDQVKSMFETEYTIFAGLIGAAFITMGTHGTDQDMVQRMLTAPDIRRSRRSLICSALADIPIALTFLSIGLLLWVYYQAHPDPTLPKTPNETFCHFILYQMPVGLRGLLLAGNLRHRHGIAQHRAERTRYEFHARLVRALPQPRSHGRTKLARRALGHCVVFRSDDHRCIDNGLSCHRASQCPNHPDRARDFRLHLRLTFGCVFRRNANQDARERSRQHHCHDPGLYRRRHPERIA
jgi:Na+/proline symporter